MTTQTEARAVEQAGRQPEGDFVNRLLRRLGPLDVLMLLPPTFLLVAVGIAPASAARTDGLVRLATLLVVGIAGVLLVRGGLLKPGALRALIYRLTLLGVTLALYLSMRGILQVANTGAFDEELYQLDLALFGFEPAMWLDQYVSPGLNEWFSFFYFGYFGLLAVHVLPLALVWDNHRPAAELAFGLLMCFAVAHCVYVLVPGWGPWMAMPERFENELPSGFWYDITMETVLAGSAMKDIFPSLHTAAPMFITLFSFRHRKLVPFKYTWPFTGFFALNIIGATMFMRWHYVIDVIAGLALAFTTLFVGAAWVRYEERRRARLGIQELWPPVAPAKNEG